MCIWVSVCSYPAGQCSLFTKQLVSVQTCLWKQILKKVVLFLHALLSTSGHSSTGHCEQIRGKVRKHTCLLITPCCWVTSKRRACIPAGLSSDRFRVMIWRMRAGTDVAVESISSPRTVRAFSSALLSGFSRDSSSFCDIVMGMNGLKMTLLSCIHDTDVSFLFLD